MNKSRFLVALGIILCLVLSPVSMLMPANTAQAQLADVPWPMFGQNPQHTGRSSYTGPGVPELAWSFNTTGAVYSSPAIGTNGTIYVGSYDNNLYAVNPDGSGNWSFATGGEVWSSPAIGADGTIYVGSYDNKLYAINPDGTQQWSFTSGGKIFSSPAIGTDGTIYVGSYDKKLYAINPDGTEQWSFTTGAAIYSSPAIGADGTIYVGSSDNKLYAINPNDGSEKWSFDTLRSVLSSPAVGADGTIYVGSYDHNLYAINPDGSEKWRFTTGDGIWSSPAIGADGTVYVGSDDNKLYAINPDGSGNWSFTTDGAVHSSPAVGADGNIYVGSYDKKLYAINPDGSGNWSFTTDGKIFSSPAIGTNSTIYVGSYDKNLHAITEQVSPPQRDLTISSTDGGSVINPGEGTFSYDEGTVVNLSASPASGYQFVNWTGDVDTIFNPNAASTTITMDDDYSITAVFEERPKYDLTISSTDGGSVTTPGEGTFTYTAGNIVSLVATPANGYQFVNWTGDVATILNPNSASTTITISGNYTIAANFEADKAWWQLFCFIATAAYGSPMAEEIQILRDFRDEYMITNPLGQAFVDFYYKVSPSIAQFINEHPSLKPIVRAGLTPAVVMSTVAVNTTPVEKAAIIGLLVLVAVAAAVWTGRRWGQRASIY